MCVRHDLRNRDEEPALERLGAAVGVLRRSCSPAIRGLEVLHDSNAGRTWGKSQYVQGAGPPSAGGDTAGSGGRGCAVELAVFECGGDEPEDGEGAGDTVESGAREVISGVVYTVYTVYRGGGSAGIGKQVNTCNYYYH